MSLRLEHINKRFGSQQVLNDVSLSIEDGEIVGLLGPNGAGKSTLMKVMVGLVKPDRPTSPVRRETAAAVGSETAVTVGSETAVAVGSVVLDVPERVGYLPEQNPLYEEMYVREYLTFMYNLRGTMYEGETAEVRVETLIKRVGLTPEAHKRIGQLSKGYRQRVGLAQALLGDPDLLVLDEPTTGLDPNQLVEIRHLIKQLGRDRMVILSTHILQEVREICDRIVILDHGEIKADKPIGEVKDLEQLFGSLTRD